MSQSDFTKGMILFSCKMCIFIPWIGNLVFKVMNAKVRFLGKYFFQQFLKRNCIILVDTSEYGVHIESPEHKSKKK